jgi:hypothetical protein
VTKRSESESRETKGPKHTGATIRSKGTERPRPSICRIFDEKFF